MSFEHDWARSAESARMRLNSAPSSGSNADLAVSPSTKRAVAGHIENELGPAVARQSSAAVNASTSVFGSSNTTPGTLQGWDTRKGLDFCLKRWDEAWRGVRGHLQREMTALRGTGNSFQGEENARVQSFQGVTPSSSPAPSRLNNL
ncbi:hypothetical protein [Streptomyces boncukensis]|uniref:Uncharacterized protein n=1 Tax=Streptomyces boncukensis TaxID=2711219 RepID=A0A6G4X0L0_9ACTN|nr:hypothetical protein [Streptomyces boncukensis]NGO71025.1 hypothetical protein [Streptomyces boncukensis]